MFRKEVIKKMMRGEGEWLGHIVCWGRGKGWRGHFSHQILLGKRGQIFL